MLYDPYTMSMSPHVPSPLRQCALVRKGGLGGLALRAGGLGRPSPPREAEGFGAARPPMMGAI